MPSGKVHDALTLFGALAGGGAFALYGPQPRDTVVALTLVGATLFSGWMLSPDLDLNSSIYKRWGPLRILWWPYQRAVPHRSFISHSWWAGPIVRVVYFLVVAWLLSHLIVWGMGKAQLAHAHPLRNPIDLISDVWARYPEHTFWAMIGILLGTVLHTGADMIWSGVKKAF